MVFELQFTYGRWASRERLVGGVVMKRSLLAVATALAVVTVFPAVVYAQSKVSGTVVAVAPDGHSFAIEELGLAGRSVRRTIALRDGARIVEVSREPGDRVIAGDWPGGFSERPLDTLDLKVGDFVTVSLNRAGDELMAIANRVERLRPDSAEAAASPRTPADPPSRPAR
jgi:hypothetical protein